MVDRADAASPDDDASGEAVWLEVLAAVYEDRRLGRCLAPAEYCDRHPQLRDWLLCRFAELDQDVPASQPSQRRVGPYVIEREIGRGGQAVVYAAADPALPRRVALKVLRGGAALSPHGRRRFAREAALAARLADPGLCAIYATGQEGDDAWIAMQLLSGGTLRDRIRGNSAAGRRPDPVATREAVTIMVSLLRTLHRLHGIGIVHRDLKPANVGFDDAGRPVVLDLGVAVVVGDLGAAITEDGVGTPAYMAPEQVQGREADARSDLHAVGVMAYEVIAGRHPFANGGHDGVPVSRERLDRAILDRDPPRLCGSRARTGGDRDLDAVLATAMAKEPELRYQTAAAFADDLTRWLEGRPVVARQASLWQRIRRWSQREPRFAAALAATILVLVTGVAVTLHLLARLQGEQSRTVAALRQARTQALCAESGRVRTTEPEASLLLALAAYDVAEGEPALSAVYSAWGGMPRRLAVTSAASPLSAADVAANGSIQVSGFADGGVRRWRLADGEIEWLARGGEPVTAVAVGDDGLGTAAANGRQLTMWREAKEVARVVCPSTVTAIVATADGRWITGHFDGRVVARDGIGKDEAELAVLASPVRAVASLPEGTVVAFAADGAVEVLAKDGQRLAAWTAAAGLPRLAVPVGGCGEVALPAPQANVVRLFQPATLRIRDVALAHEVAWFASVGDSGTLLVQCTNGRPLVVRLPGEQVQPLSHDGPVVAIAGASNGAFAFACADGTCSLVFPDGRRQILRLGNCVPRVLQFATDETLLVIGADGAGWRWTAGALTLAQPAGPYAEYGFARFDPDGALCMGVPGGVVRFGPPDGERHFVAAASPIVGFDFDRCGRGLLSTTRRGDLELLATDGSRRNLVEHAAPAFAAGLLGSDRFVGADEQCARVFAADGQVLAEVGLDGVRVTALACAMGGDSFALGGEDGSVGIFDRSGALVRRFGVDSAVEKLQFAANGRLAIVERRGFVSLCGSHGEQGPTWQAQIGRVEDLAFDGVGDRMLVAGVEGVARSFDCTGNRLLDLRPAVGSLLAARFVPGRAVIVTVAERGDVHLWSSADGRLLAHAAGFGAAVLCADVAPDGRWLALTEAHAGCRLLPLDAGDLLARARASLAAPVITSVRDRYRDLLRPLGYTADQDAGR